MTTARDRLERLWPQYRAEIDHLPRHRFGTQLRVQGAFIIVDALQRILGDMNVDPHPILASSIDCQIPYIREAARTLGAFDAGSPTPAKKTDPSESCIELFENAWTTYSDATYDHSVELVRRRLIANGFDESFFRGKVCFDGGCGTGRLSVAMAQLGAKKVVAADLGSASLEYFAGVVERMGLTTIEIVETDVTDLSRYPDAAFDFVASYGVLHHTRGPERGLREHFRVTRPGGTFWLYLYGDGGVYWWLHDQVREMLAHIPITTAKSILLDLGVREGFVYTFLDNVYAPRVYYYRDDVVRLLEKEGTFRWASLRGTTARDDPERSLKTKYGAEIFGPEGEVRLRIDRT